VLSPSDELRYSPGSLVVVVSASADDRDRFVERVFEDRAAILSPDKVRALLTGRVAAAELEARVGQLLAAAVQKRLQASETVVLAVDGLDAGEREPYLRMAAGLKRPRHLVLLETSRDQVGEEDRAPLNELRRALDAGDVGAEGFQTAVRLGGGMVAELKRIVFESAARDR